MYLGRYNRALKGRTREPRALGGVAARGPRTSPEGNGVMHISRRVLAVAGTLTVLVGVGTAAGAAIAAGPVSSGVVSACYKTVAASNGSHAVVLENTGHTCPSG